MKLRLYKWLMRSRLASVDEACRLLSKCASRNEKERYQVERFNSVWRTAYSSVPFYRHWKDDYKLPDTISSLAELGSWPILTKGMLRNIEAFKRVDVPVPNNWIMTGGSSGEPIRMPSWGDAQSGISQIIGRMAYGVSPGDRTFLLWGHEHLYGTGLKRRVYSLKRRLKDWLADWDRVSAYDLSARAMHNAYMSFERFRPKFIIGFSSAVLAFVRHNKDKGKCVDSVRVVLCTAGPLTTDEKAEIEDFFDAVVCMEYGSVECGVMAYTRPADGRYNVFWNTHLLQAQKQPNGEFKNIVTRLTDSYVPLIRYDIGDYLDIDSRSEEENSRSTLEIISVKGRPSEMITFKCGVSFFGALIGDCVKQVPSITASQIAVDEGRNILEIRVVATEALSDEETKLIKGRFSLTVAGAEKLSLSVVQVDQLYITVGGKTPRVVRL